MVKNYYYFEKIKNVIRLKNAIKELKKHMVTGFE